MLLRKLELYGITDRNYAWIKIYLSNRLQYMQVDENCRTEYCVVKCGVPQGSIIVPLPFLLHANDLKKCIFRTRSCYVCRWREPFLCSFKHKNSYFQR